MQPVPLFRTSVLRPLLSHVERSGLRPERLFGPVLPLLQRREALLPLSEGGRAFAAAANELGSELGIALGERTRVEAIGEFGALLRTSETLGEALRLAVRHGSRFNTGQRFSLASRGDEVSLHHRISPSLVHGRLLMRDFALALTLGLLRLGAGGDWRPAEIHLEGAPPAHAERLAALATRSVRFGAPTNAVVFEKRTLALPIPGGFVHKPSRAELPSHDGATSLRQVIEALLPLGAADAVASADAAGLSLRSFQRRLRAARLSFRDLLQQVRRTRALRLLADPGAKVVEVASALGYTDAANFTRAFRAWTGLSPQEYRRALAVEPAA